MLIGVGLYACSPRFSLNGQKTSQNKSSRTHLNQACGLPLQSLMQKRRGIIKKKERLKTSLQKNKKKINRYNILLKAGIR